MDQQQQQQQQTAAAHNVVQDRVHIIKGDSTSLSTVPHLGNQLTSFIHTHPCLYADALWFYTVSNPSKEVTEIFPNPSISFCTDDLLVYTAFFADFGPLNLVIDTYAYFCC